MRTLDKLTHGGIEDGYFSVFVAGINGIFSGIGCILTIWIISKSESRLSDTYHRIMFAVSIIGLVVVATGSLSYCMFPKDDELLEWPYFIHGNILRLGSTLSCNVQGAASMGGYFMYQAYISMLLLYYYCAIVPNMRSITITKWVEPALHLIPIIIGLVTVLWGLFTQSFNPHPTMPWCAFIRYPAACPDHCWAPDDEGCQCIRSNPEQDFLFNKRFIPAMLFLFSGIDFFCLFSISIRFLRNHLELKSCHTKLTETGPESDELHQLRFRESSTKAALFQAFLYVLVLIALFVTSVLCQSNGSGPTYDIINGFRIYIVTLQGFFYYAIFLYIKVHNLRTIEPHLSILDSIKRVHAASSDDRVILVGLSNVSVKSTDSPNCDVGIRVRRTGNMDLSARGSKVPPDVASVETPPGATIGERSEPVGMLCQSFEAFEDHHHDMESRISHHSQSLGSMFSFHNGLDDENTQNDDDLDNSLNDREGDSVEK